MMKILIFNIWPNDVEKIKTQRLGIFNSSKSPHAVEFLDGYHDNVCNCVFYCLKSDKDITHITLHNRSVKIIDVQKRKYRTRLNYYMDELIMFTIIMNQFKWVTHFWWVVL